MKSYHLKWASHLPNMGLVFSTLYQSEGLSDVTLVCEDGSVRAHKLLLSTCSDYFLVSGFYYISVTQLSFFSTK